MKPGYLDYNSKDFETGVNESTSADLWSDLERILTDLEETRYREQDRMEDQIERIESQLDIRDQIYQSNISILKEKLREEQKRLTRSKTSAGINEERTRDNIRELHHAMRSERNEWWQDKQKLHREKRELEREIDELLETCIDDWMSSGSI